MTLLDNQDFIYISHCVKHRHTNKSNIIQNVKINTYNAKDTIKVLYKIINARLQITNEFKKEYKEIHCTSSQHGVATSCRVVDRYLKSSLISPKQL